MIVEIRRLQKTLNFAGHHGTRDEEALVGLRMAHALLDKAGLSMEDLIIDADPNTVHPLRLATLIRLGEQEAEIERLKAQNEREHMESNRAKDETQRLRAQINRLQSELQQVKVRRDNRATSEMPFDINLLMAGMSELRKSMGDVRIGAALAALYAMKSNGQSVKQITESVDDLSESSVRYALRSFGPGWPGKRAGHGLVGDYAHPDHGRTRLWGATARGRRLLNEVILAMSKSKPLPSEPEIGLAA